jgi:hypothetical protein
VYHVSGFPNAGENELTRRTGEQQSRGERCAICESRRQQATVEIFQFSDEVDTYIFKIDTAKEIVADGRAAQPVSQEMLRAFAGMNEFNLDHMISPVREFSPGVLALPSCWTELIVRFAALPNRSNFMPLN